MLRRAVRSARWHHVGVHGALTLQFWIGADARPHPRVDRKEFEEESPGLGRVRLFVKSARIKSGEMMKREEKEILEMVGQLILLLPTKLVKGQHLLEEEDN